MERGGVKIGAASRRPHQSLRLVHPPSSTHGIWLPRHHRSVPPRDRHITLRARQKQGRRPIAWVGDGSIARDRRVVVRQGQGGEHRLLLPGAADDATKDLLPPRNRRLYALSLPPENSNLSATSLETSSWWRSACVLTERAGPALPPCAPPAAPSPLGPSDAPPPLPPTPSYPPPTAACSASRSPGSSAALAAKCPRQRRPGRTSARWSRRAAGGARSCAP